MLEVMQQFYPTWSKNCRMLKLQRKKHLRSDCKHLLETGVLQRISEEGLSVLYSRAFDSVDHEKLWVAVKEMGVPQRLIVLMRNLHCGQKSPARRESGETEWFPIGKGVRQGFILSPYLYNLYTEHIIQKTGLHKRKEE